MKKIKVLLVDDHRIMREGIRRLLDLDEAMEVVGEAETGEEALAQAQLTHPDIVLMDIRIPGMDGIEATRRLRTDCPGIQVIMLTSYAEEYVAEAIQAGAAGYMLKSIGHEELCQAIRRVSAGESVIDRTLSRDLFRRFASLTSEDHGPSKRDVLSDHELHILECLASGMKGKEIAAQLFISETALKRYLRRIFDKLGVDSRVHAIAEAYRRGLLKANGGLADSRRVT